ncbi:hypothetical protein FRC03_008034 [Tulasnella sp. 419]|nr:hypothetical protein FRC02_005595 [Tulasnella sp. 418]KAG8937583.1 hypothetical protein FRC03_008034 [Tulasnella sp. 419]
MQKYPDNNAGAKYGTGYCDAKCPSSVRCINGEATPILWVKNGPLAEGLYGSCCPEIDLWGGNSVSTAFTHHPGFATEPYRCEHSECDEVCDQDGCDFNSY